MLQIIIIRPRVASYAFDEWRLVNWDQIFMRSTTKRFDPNQQEKILYLDSTTFSGPPGILCGKVWTNIKKKFLIQPWEDFRISTRVPAKGSTLSLLFSRKSRHLRYLLWNFVEEVSVDLNSCKICAPLCSNSTKKSTIGDCKLKSLIT